MKKLLLLTMLLICGMTTAMAQKPAEIKFDVTTHHFGEFSKTNSKQTCKFTFANVGDEPLIIHQAVASCGCTVPTYTKEPILPGGKGVIEVTYNGAGKSLGFFKKSITVRTNGQPEMTRIYIDGTMTE